MGRLSTVVRRVAAVLGAAVLGAAGLVAAVAVGPASAHNVLLSSTPAAGSTVAVLPSLLVMHYDLPAQALGTVVIVHGPSGNVADGPAELIDTDVEQPVRPGSPAGAYTVDWRVVSADGHVVQGSFAFTARAASTGSASPLPSAIRAGTIPTSAPGSTALLWVGIGVGVAVVGVVVLLVARGRTTSEGDEEEDDEDDEDDQDDDGA